MAQAKQEGVTSKLRTPNIIDQNITPAQVSNAQKEDVSLRTLRSRCEANETVDKATFFKRNDLSSWKNLRVKLTPSNLYLCCIVKMRFEGVK